MAVDGHSNGSGSRFVGLLVLMLCFRPAHCQLAGFSIVGKAATQSSTTNQHVAANAADEKPLTFSHTLGREDLHPWWSVALGTTQCLGRITVILRKGCCGDYRTTGLVVRVGMSSNYSNNVPCGSPTTKAQTADGAEIPFLCDPPMRASFVTVDIDPSAPTRTEVTENTLLQMSDVTVEVYVGDECVQYADPVPNPGPPVPLSVTFDRLLSQARIANSDPKLLLSTEVSLSATSCAGRCIVHSVLCNSLDYETSAKRCRLFSLETGQIITAPEGGTSVYTFR